MHNKCACDVPWKGSVVVLRKDRQVFVRHGDIYIHCHPCRLVFEHDTGYNNKNKNSSFS